MPFLSVAKGLTDRQDTYDLNDGIGTVGDAVDRFQHGEARPDIANVRVNGRPAGSFEDTVRDGDNIIIQEEAVRAGGLKGAA